MRFLEPDGDDVATNDGSEMLAVAFGRVGDDRVMAKVRDEGEYAYSNERSPYTQTIFRRREGEVVS